MEITNDQLSKNNGKDGNAAYVAVNAKVYDVTESRLWKNGVHMNRHQAGEDLSAALSAAPHGAEVLNKFSQPGTLKPDEMPESSPVPGWLMKLLDAYPFFKRHPHPMVVHFPMAFFITAPLFLFWYYVIDPAQSLLDAVLYMHILGTLALPVALLTGWLSWLVNYLGKANSKITQKIILSIFVLIADIIVLISLLSNPAVLTDPGGIQLAIPILIFSYLPVVSIIGALGGSLVFPVHK
ncbi:hypothetical protein JXJ21_01190 [candidate division KSB1 bacterium]|nr:hypothetical protein [candidate division KSB1 bacterium]